MSYTRFVVVYCDIDGPDCARGERADAGRFRRDRGGPPPSWTLDNARRQTHLPRLPGDLRARARRKNRPEQVGGTEMSEPNTGPSGCYCHLRVDGMTCDKCAPPPREVVVHRGTGLCDCWACAGHMEEDAREDLHP